MQPVNLLQLFPNPFIMSDLVEAATIIWDTAECYDDEQSRIDILSGIGFEPYAVTQEMDIRPESIAKMKLQGFPISRVKRWFRRPRNPHDEAIVPVNLPSTDFTPGA